MKLPKASSDLEIELGVFEDAENCKIWDLNTNYYIYVFKDITQLDLPIVYVGISHNDQRRSRHWNSTHSQYLQNWIDYWKTENLIMEDVSEILVEGLNQREAACLETFIIATQKPEANVKYYWTPDQRAEHSVEARHHHSILMSGRRQPRSGVNKAAKTRTNNDTYDLLLDSEIINTFEGASASSISNWILENCGETVSPSSLWATIKEKKGRTYKGFKLVKTSESDGLTAKTLILRAITGKPIMIKDVKGQLRFFINSDSAAQSLNINSGDLASSSRGDRLQSQNYNSRYLSEFEISSNIEKWPVYHLVTIDGKEHKFFNISKFCEKHKLIKGTVHKLLSGSQEYCITAGKRVEGSTVWKHESLELFDLEVSDDLKLPINRSAKRKSEYAGVFWHDDRQTWNIRVSVNEAEVNFGYVKNEEIAKEISLYVSNNKSDPNVVEDARKLLRQLKIHSGERVKKDEHLRSMGSGRELLENAAKVGQEIIERAEEIPKGKDQRKNWYEINYGIDVRVGQRYSQVAREKLKRPADFKSSKTISEFLKKRFQ